MTIPSRYPSPAPRSGTRWGEGQMHVTRVPGKGSPSWPIVRSNSAHRDVTRGVWEFKARFGGDPSVGMALRRARVALKKIDGYFGRLGGRAAATP